MNTIEEIIIKVPSNIAEAYRRSTKEEQEQIQLKLALIMESNLFNNRKSVDLASRGINEEQAANLTARLQCFAEDWDQPEMEVYDAL
ncbi:MAG: hypothetical protein RLZZ507_2738 [Cyanobacteriota bacterium]|jgi:hypothetical protein